METSEASSSKKIITKNKKPNLPQESKSSQELESTPEPKSPEKPKSSQELQSPEKPNTSQELKSPEKPRTSQRSKSTQVPKSPEKPKSSRELKSPEKPQTSQELKSTIKPKSSQELKLPEKSKFSPDSKPTKGSTQDLKYPSENFDDNDDLVASINYNTITSLAALKDILQGEGTDTLETDSFFHHYFMNHCNNLSSRNSSSPFPFPEKRRLSQCREEDEDTDKKDKNPLSSSNPSKSEENKDKLKSTEDDAQKRTVMGVHHKFLVTTAKPHPLRFLNQTHNAHTVHFGTKGAEEIRPNVKTIFDSSSFHRDKKYFDSSLIEIRSNVDDEVTPPTEDIWIKRDIPKPAKTVRVSQPLPVHSPEEQAKGVRPRRVSMDDAGRSRASSWSSRKDKIPLKKYTSDKNKKKIKSKDEDDFFTSSSQSVRDKQKWGSADDVETRYQQTIHGTSGVSRRPALFDIFKSNKRSDAKKHNLIQQMVEAVQNIGKSTSKESNVEKKDSTKDVKISTRDGSAHPHAGSDAKYYHTMTAGSQRRPSSAISKVVDIFRYRPNPNEAADKRKARAILQHSQQTSAGANIQMDLERRRSLGQLPRQQLSDSPIDPYRAALLVRDERGVPTVVPYLVNHGKQHQEEDEAQIFVKFFKYHTCYDLMPTSAKLVIFDTKLRVKKAFFALVDNGVRAAPLWDSENQRFVGMLTITDFIKILQMYYTSPDVTMDELEEHRLETWQAVLKNSVIPLVSITPKSSLLDAIKILIANKIHRLPVIDPDTGDVIHILTHKRILRFLFLYINEIPKPSYLNRKIRDIRIGTFSDIEVATEDTLIIDALTKFVNRRVSALPIVDAEGRLKDIYAKFDVINLAAEKTYNNLNVTLKKANEYRNSWFEGVQKCTLNETIITVMERLVKAEVHRLVVVDEEDKVTGIISLSDLLQYIAVRPLEESAQSAAQRAARQTGSIDESEESLSTETLKDTDRPEDSDIIDVNEIDDDDIIDEDLEETEQIDDSEVEKKELVDNTQL